MPISGQKDADGYTWNGGAWVSQDGYAKGSPEDKRNKQGWWGKAWDITKDVTNDLTKAETWANPAGDNASGVFGAISTANKMFNPWTSIGEAKLEYNKGNYLDMASNLGIAAFKALPFGKTRVVGQFAKGTKTAHLLSPSRFNGTITRAPGLAAGLTRARYATHTPVFRRPGTIISQFSNAGIGGKAVQLAAAGAGAYGVNQYGSQIMQGAKPMASDVLPGPSTTRDMSMTADQMERRAAMERNRTDAAGNSGMGGRRVVSDITVENRPPGGYPGAPGAAVPAPLDLAPLTPEQLNETGQDLVELEQVYQDALNQYGLSEKQGRQGYVQDVQGARRQAAGSAEDLAGQLAAAGLDISPAAAFSAGQMTDAPRMARETSARKTLDQLLAEITKGRTQARTKRDRDQLMTNNQINAYRNQNSFDAQQAAYERMAGN